MKYIKVIVILIFCFFGSLCSDAQVINKSYSIPDINAGLNVSGSTPTSDGGLLISGFETYYSGNNDPTPGIGFIMKVDSVGDLIWLDTFQKVAAYGDPELTSDGGFLVGLKTLSISSNGSIVSTAYEVAKFDDLGNLLFKVPTNAYSTPEFNLRYFEINNQIIIAKGSPFLSWERYNLNTGVRIDSVGYSLGINWFTQTFNYSHHSDISSHGNEHRAISTDSKIAISGHLHEYYMPVGGVRKNAALLIIDSLGNTIDFKYQTYSDTTTQTYATGVASTSDGGFIIAAKRGTNSGFFIRTDASGDTLWTKDVGTVTSIGGSHLGVLSNGNIICWDKLYDYQGNWIRNTNFGSRQGGTHIGDSIAYVVYSRNDSLHINIHDLLGQNTYSNYIRGNVYNDLNIDCAKNGTDLGLNGIRIKAEGNYTFYGTTDTAGNYSILVDTGTYTVSAILPSVYWTGCNSNQVVHFSAAHVVDTIDIALQDLISCPMLEVDLSAPFIRATGGGSVYTISYHNNGTADAINASVVVDLDPHLNVLSTSIPIFSQNGNVYTFNIGTVLANDGGDFHIQVIIDSLAVTPTGRAFCSEAHIYPDSICIPNYWNGPILEVDGQCLNDTVHFLLENVGAPMSQTHQYYVYEDNVMFRTGNTNVLGVGGSQQISTLALAGKTYRINVKQATGFPALLGDSIATAVVEGCVLDSIGAFNVGFVTQLPNGNGSPSIAVDCQQGISAYDPNDKAAQPKGYGKWHFIEQNTAIDYKIRFQNTGNDTAFLVVVRDTISPFLDPATLVMGASSHPYTWTLSHEGILEVFFKNIMLPDSNINEPASHGFFKYKIQQQEDNPLGTIINNRAAIYFDYNPPIITNTTYHTVGKDFILLNLSIGAVLDPRVEVKVYPNPFHQQTTIAIEGQEYQHLKLRIIDVTGRTSVVKEVYSKATLQLSKDNLQTGVYFYTLEGDGQLINTGKIVVQ